MSMDDENPLRPGSSDELLSEGEPATYPEYIARIRAVAKRIMDRIKKVSDEPAQPLQHEEPTSLPFEEPTVEAPPDPPPTDPPFNK